ncbi:hypothetical protein K493DRAFT_304185 [Basidiobolus meristosporus CBS 931.73]|uniref:Uncharacterized protein n=1 Tax=Basidiobolus meristosporus CBS 931.73 TaxID=1314790 RepID=A0A1Y1XZW0_9FUNG|nr:hypothetical protein K493DRAFT_304185 [Basidiobolus meristosporus CBS 931.73]|eukprot:ORX91287.1 hypothetical protein K493DRAFT_304185 [Basidiobolus meristosporus CBS 931.73]
MTFDLQEIVNIIRSSLSAELQEMILFYVGDVILYFDFFEKPGRHFEALIIDQGGPGFILEESIRVSHKPLLRWLLNAVSYPIDYLLTSAVCYGDLCILSHLATLIGESYKEYDTPAKLFCVLKGKVRLLEYLFHRNPSFRSERSWAECIHSCLLIGITESREVYSWYLRNQNRCPRVSKEDRIKACLQNNNIDGVMENVDQKRLGTLIRALSNIPIASEKTYRKLMRIYASEADILTFIARACARLGYVDTLEILFNEPYNVHVEHDFFANIPTLAVVKVLHKYASQRNIISCMLGNGRIRKVKSPLGIYQTPTIYRKLLRTFTDSTISDMDTISDRKEHQLDDVLFFLVDLAEVTSSADLLKKYTLYAIEFGHLKLLQRLFPYLKEGHLQSIAQEIEAGNPDVYESRQPQVVEFLFAAGITQQTSFSLLTDGFELEFIQNLVEKGLVKDNTSGAVVEWSMETRRRLVLETLFDISMKPYQFYRSEKDYLMDLIHSTGDVVDYGSHYCTFERNHARPITFSTREDFSRSFRASCRSHWVMYPSMVISDVESTVRVTNMWLLLPRYCKDIEHIPL